MIWNYKFTISNLKSAILNLKGLTFFLSIGLILYATSFLSFQKADAGTQLTVAEVLEQLQAKAKTFKKSAREF